MSEWDRSFVEQFTVRDGTFFDIIIVCLPLSVDIRRTIVCLLCYFQAANYLDIKLLVKTICKSVIYMIRGKSSEEIRQIFKLVELLDETTNNSSIISQADTQNK